MNSANSVLDECASTNDVARQLAESGHPHGTWVSTRRQGAGRGRLGRKWETIEGNLFLSIIARKPEQPLWSWVPLATAVAVADCLRAYHPKFEVEIKWPNDLWVNRSKLGGILCEAVGSRTDSFLIIGLGLNCAGSPKGLDQATTSLSEAGPKTVADDIRLAIVSSILETLSTLSERGPAQIAALYEKYAALPSGSEIEWQASGTGAVSSARVIGLGAHGELLVRDENGSQQRLYAEDVKVRAGQGAGFGSPA